MAEANTNLRWAWLSAGVPVVATFSVLIAYPYLASNLRNQPTASVLWSLGPWLVWAFLLLAFRQRQSRLGLLANGIGAMKAMGLQLAVGVVATAPFGMVANESVSGDYELNGSTDAIQSRIGVWEEQALIVPGVVVWIVASFIARRHHRQSAPQPGTANPSQSAV